MSASFLETNDGKGKTGYVNPQPPQIGSKRERNTTNDSSSTSPKMETMDNFLASMTFASRATMAEFCDCDEPNCTQRNVIPADVAAAIEDYKQKKRRQDASSSSKKHNGGDNNEDSSDGNDSDSDGSFHIPLTFRPKVIQTRQLLFRQGSPQLSIWKWTMPVDADPLLEYGNNHRIMYIRNLPAHTPTTPKSDDPQAREQAEDPSASTTPSQSQPVSLSKLVSIGKGVFGSSDEEKNRKDTGWQQGQFYIVPSNGGKSLGWIHKRKKGSTPDPDPQKASASSVEVSHAETKDVLSEEGSAVAEIITIKIDPYLCEEGASSEIMDDEDYTSLKKVIFVLKRHLDDNDSSNQVKSDTYFHVTNKGDIDVLKDAVSQYCNQTET
jgi:hypothetical protein